MKIEHLREFLQLADNMNITAASKELFISQSTLSRHVKALEKEFGFHLLKTSNHGIELTPAGKDSLHTFRKIVKEYDAYLSRNGIYKSSYTGCLRFGILYYLLDEYYFDFLEEFQKKYPGIQLMCMSNYQPHTLHDDLMYGKIDIGTMSVYRGEIPENLRFQKTDEFNCVAMMKKCNPLASKKSIILSDLVLGTMIKLRLDEVSQKQIDRMLAYNGFQAQKIVYTDNIETVPSKIRYTDGFHITSEKCRKQNASGIAYVPIVGKHMTFDLGVASIETDNKLVNLFFEELKLNAKKDF